MNKTKRAALYERVSTYEQVKHGYSLPAQAQELQEYAARCGYEVAAEYIEDGMSGASMSRPALQRLLADAAAGKFDTVIIYKQDRLSRSTKDTIEIVEQLIAAGVGIVSLNENIDWKSPAGRAMLKMMATFSEMERENILERTAMGKAFKAASGIYSNQANLPAGYRWDKETKRLEPDDRAPEIVKIFELYLKGFSMRKIGKYLGQNFPDRYGYPLAAKRILYNPIYAGYMRSGGKLVKAQNVTPILDVETYLKVEQLREENRKMRTREDSPYLLVGLLRCGVCGQRYAAKRYDHDSGGRRYVYYRYGCEARQRFDPDYHAGKCKNSPIINTADLEAAVLEHLQAAEFESGDVSASSGAMDVYIEENIQLKEKISKLLDLYEGGLIDKAALEERVLAHNKRIDRNDRAIAELAAEVKAAPTVSLDEIRERLAAFDTLEYPERRLLLKAFIKQITIYPGGRLEIVYKIKQKLNKTE